jgi:hypothetical protein
MVSNYDGPYWTREGGAEPQWREDPRKLGWTDDDSQTLARSTGRQWYWSEDRRCYVATRDGQTTPADLAERIATGGDGGLLAAEFWVMAARVAATTAAWRLDAAVLADAASPTFDNLATLTAAERAHDTALATLTEVETIRHEASAAGEGLAPSLDSASTTEDTREATAHDLGEPEDLTRAQRAHHRWDTEGDQRALWTELGQAAPGVRAAFWNARAQRGLGTQARITPPELASAHREASREDPETPHDSHTYPTPAPGAGWATRDIDAAHERVVDAAGTLQIARATVTCDSLGVLAEAERAYEAAVAARDALLDLDDPAPDSPPGGTVLDDGYLTCPASSSDPRVRTDAGATEGEDLDCTLDARHDDGGQHLSSSGTAWVDPTYTGPGLGNFPTEPHEALGWTPADTSDIRHVETDDRTTRLETEREVTARTGRAPERGWHQWHADHAATERSAAALPEHSAGEDSQDHASHHSGDHDVRAASDKETPHEYSVADDPYDDAFHHGGGDDLPPVPPEYTENPDAYRSGSASTGTTTNEVLTTLVTDLDATTPDFYPGDPAYQAHLERTAAAGGTAPPPDPARWTATGDAFAAAGDVHATMTAYAQQMADEHPIAVVREPHRLATAPNTDTDSPGDARAESDHPTHDQPHGYPVEDTTGGGDSGHAGCTEASATADLPGDLTSPETGEPPGKSRAAEAVATAHQAITRTHRQHTDAAHREDLARWRATESHGDSAAALPTEVELASRAEEPPAL